MRRVSSYGVAAVSTLAACGGNGTGPDDAPGGTAGAHYTDRQHPSSGDPLAGKFAVAMYDSVGGRAPRSAEPQSSGTGFHPRSDSQRPATAPTA